MNKDLTHIENVPTKDGFVIYDKSSRSVAVRWTLEGILFAQEKTVTE